MTGTKLNILLADDDEGVKSMFDALLIPCLKKAGAEVKVYASADECIESINNGFSPDVAILDYDMPCKGRSATGMDVARYLRRKGLETKIAIFTSQDKARIESGLKQCGADYFPKETLMDEIKSYILDSRGQK